MSMIDHDHQDELRARSAADLAARRYRRGDGAVFREHSRARGIDGPVYLVPADAPRNANWTVQVGVGELARLFTRCDPGVSCVGSPAAPAFPTPAELRARVESADASAVAALAATIAKALESRWSPGERVVVDVTQPQRVVDAAATLLRDAGWVVSYSSDQRDSVRTLAITAPAP